MLLSTANVVFGAISGTFTAIGAIMLLSAFTPQLLATLKTRNTVSILKSFFIYNFATSSLMLVGSIALLATITKWGDLQHVWVAIPLTMLNIIMTIYNMIFIKIKTANETAAAQHGLSENDYYNQILKPSLDSESLDSESQN